MNERIDQLELSLIRSGKDNDDSIEIIKDLSWEYIKISEYEKAKIYTDQLLHIAERLQKNELIKEAHFYYGRIYVNFCEYEKALSHYYESMILQKELNDQYGITNIDIEIGNLFYKSNDINRALEHFEQALNRAETNHLEELTGYVLNNLALISFDTKDYDKTLEYLFKALDILKVSDYTLQNATCLLNIGETYLNKKEYSVSKEYIDQSISLFEQLQDSSGICYSCIIKGSYLTEIGAYSEAEKCYQQAYQIALEIDRKDQLVSVYKKLSDFYLIQKDYMNAYEYQKLFLELSNKLFSEENQLKIAKLESIYKVEIKQKEAEIFRLKTEELQKAVNEAETAYKKLEEMQEQMISIEKKNAVLAMAVTANHEINQPLMIIRAAKDLLQINLEDCVTCKDIKLFQKMDNAIQRIQSILSSFSELDNLSFIAYDKNTKMLNLKQINQEE